MGSALRAWDDFLGYCLSEGMGDPRDMYLDQMCSLIWFLAIRGKEDVEVERMKAELWIPPDGVEVDERSPWHPSNQLKNLQRVKTATS